MKKFLYLPFVIVLFGSIVLQAQQKGNLTPSSDVPQPMQTMPPMPPPGPPPPASTPDPGSGAPPPSGSGANIPAFGGDGRIGNLGTAGAIYANPSGIVVYGIDSDSEGFVAVFASEDDIKSVPPKPETNTLIKRSVDGKYAIYRLDTGEFQVNVGPDRNGDVRVVIFPDLSGKGAYGYQFNVFDILGIR